MSSYTIEHNFIADTRQQKQLGSSNIAILLGVFNKTVIPLILLGYEIVIANSALCASLAQPSKFIFFFSGLWPPTVQVWSSVKSFSR